MAAVHALSGRLHPDPTTTMRELQRLSAAAWQALRIERFAPALRAFDKALALAAPTGPADTVEPRGTLLYGQVLALLEMGRLARAEASLRELEAALERAAGSEAAHALSPLARIARVKLLLLTRDATRARALLEPLLDDPSQLTPEAHADALYLMATAMCLLGANDLAVVRGSDAVARLRNPALALRQRGLAGALTNLAAARFERGQPARALELFEEVAAISEGLADTGPPGRAYDAARVHLNLGGTCQLLGDAVRSMRHYRRANRWLDRLDAAAGEEVAKDRRTALRAKVAMNFGFVLLERGRHAEARRRLTEALALHRRLGSLRRALRHDEGRIEMNLAHALATEGATSEALRRYRRAARLFDALIESGREEAAQDAAYARFGIARMLAAQGRAGAAAPLLQAAARSLVALCETGQLQQAHRWWIAMLDQVEVMLRRLLETKQVQRSLTEALLAVLAEPPRTALTEAALLRQDIDRGCRRLVQWKARTRRRAPAAAWLDRVAPPLLARMLALAAQVLAETAPDELRRDEAAFVATIDRLGEVALAMPDPALAAADWFLHTHGLRAQRNAIASGVGASFDHLRSLLDELHRVESLLLGRPAEAGASPPNARAATGASDTDRLPAGREALQVHWHRLHGEWRAERERLVNAGTLPAALRLDAAALSRRLGPHQALVLLARLRPDRIVAVALRAAGRAGGSAHLHRARLAPESAALDCGQAHLLLMAGVAAQQTGQAARRCATDQAAPPVPAHGDAEAMVHRWHAALIDTALRELVDGLVADGCDDIALVPAGDLHLVPFKHHLSRLPLSVYPNAGAWARWHGARPTEAATKRWAVLANAALDSPTPLPWVSIESALADELMRPIDGGVVALDPAGPCADGVGALLAMGHGSTGSGGSPGLLSSAGGVFTAHQLPPIRHCERLVVSACVLGRTDEVLGEPTGFLAESFGYRTHFAVGWLVEVPDAEACLFSAALLHGWIAARSEAAPLAVFDRVRLGVAEGRWPEGFGAWLGATLPLVLDRLALPPGRWLNRFEYLRDFDGGCFNVPPPSLRRLMPWVVALGR